MQLLHKEVMAVGIRRSYRGVDLDFDFGRITDNVKDAFFYKIEVIVGEDLALYLGIAGENRLFGIEINQLQVRIPKLEGLLRKRIILAHMLGQHRADFRQIGVISEFHLTSVKRVFIH